MEDMTVIHLFVQIIKKNRQIPFRTEDCPMDHFPTDDVKAISLKLLLLTIKRDSIDILGIENVNAP